MRRLTLSLLLLVVGVEAGILIDHFFLWRRPSRIQAAPPAAAVVMDRDISVPEPVQCEATGSFGNNLYPSLLLSFGSSYPEYARFLTVVVRHAPVGRRCEIRIESGLFEQPYVHAAAAPAEGFDISPDLPWNYAALRKVSQLRPESFVVSVLVDNRPAAQATLACMIHPVNEVVSRVYDASTGEWQDTSVCYAAFVNEDSTWINSFLQEALARGGVPRFAGYATGAQAVVPQVQAVWDTLAARGLRYVDLATFSGGVPEVTTQYVRFLGDSVRDQGANCVDASVLLASIFRRIGLRPVLLFKPGHCFVAVYDAAQDGHLVALETTMLGTAPFSSAMTFGGQELETALTNMGTPGYSTVDIVLARQEGVMPIGD